MKATHSLSLAVFIAALTLLLLSSCGTMGDGGGSNLPEYSSDSQQPSSSSSDGTKGACQAYDGQSGLTLCVGSTLSSIGLTEEECEDEWQWIPKCADNYALRCFMYAYVYVYVYGNLPYGTTCFDLGLF
ncbi:MAG: hypothetical protein LBC85_03605 [Fibromonadaceae bacterium]|jgi:hypothetical protein|nr:hypothetical protein [Fibromonadaceae bacterium]